MFTVKEYWLPCGGTLDIFHHSNITLVKKFIKVTKALSDPNRLKILKILQRSESCVCELKKGLGIAQPTVSKHLKILGDAGLVESRKEGLRVYYRVSEGQSSPYAATLIGSLRHWLEEDPEVKETLETFHLKTGKR